MSSTSGTLHDVQEEEFRPPKRDRRRLVAVLLLIPLAGGIAVGLFFALRGGGQAATSKLPARPTPLDPAASELVALLAKGQEGLFHAKYKATAPDQPGASLTIEIWRKDSLSRQDSVASNGTRTVHTAAFRLSAGDMACRREEPGPWSCQPIQKLQSDPGQLTALATTELSGRSVTVRDETIGGRRGRCFTIVGEGQSSELCLTPEGIALRIAAGPARLDLVSLDRSVGDAVFRTPA